MWEGLDYFAYVGGLGHLLCTVVPRLALNQPRNGPMDLRLDLAHFVEISLGLHHLYS